MASKFIKIYNDTVLKQTILQGYETQRTNPNLGKISMGELAFTRDTGRVFVGNFSSDTNDKELPLDTRAINGGILTGNKYIGLIDSKPLGHWSTTGSNGTFPLNYSSTTTDSSTEESEPGVFSSGSRFRPYKTDSKGNVVKDENKNPVHKRGGDGWDKSADYIQEYGVYSGDFAFDIFSNALIIFDKNIKPGEEIKRKWENGKEIFLNSKNEDITATTIRRTKIEDHPDSKTSEYPIYGKGYVMMRILEPDGITINYMDRQFDKGVPYSSSTDSETYAHLQWPNWSHNILKVNYPATNIFNEACDSDLFILKDGKISINTEELKLTGQSAELPSKLSYSSGLTLNYIGSLTGIESGYLSVDSNGNVKPEEMPTMRISASVGEGLSINGIPNGSITLTDSAPDFTISLVKDESGSLSTGANPWGLTFEGSYIYSGVAAYATGGILASLNKYEDAYVTTTDTNANNDFTNVVTKLWDSTNNDGINLLKNPYPIQAHTGSVKGRFIISPCIAKLGSGNTGTTITPSAQYSTSGVVTKDVDKIEVEGSDDKITEVTVTSTTTSYIHEIKGFTYEGKLTTAGKYRIPKHASSVILEIHHLSDILVQTASDYNSFNSLTNNRNNLADDIVSATTNTVSLPSIPTSTTNKVLLRASGSGIDTVEVPLITIKQDEYEVEDKDGKVTTHSDTYAKFFQYGINTSGNVLINVIGYRV